MIKLDYSYTRENGANLLVAKMTFQEIRQGTVKESFQDIEVKDPADAKKESTGTLAPQEKK